VRGGRVAGGMARGQTKVAGRGRVGVTDEGRNKMNQEMKQMGSNE